METRKDNGYLKLLNGTVPSREGGEINGSKLPTNKQVPLSLLSNLKSMSYNATLSTTFDTNILHCKRANIPMINGRNTSRRNAIEQGVQKYFDSTIKFYRNSVLNHLEPCKNGKVPSEQKSIDKDIKFISSRIRD